MKLEVTEAQLKAIKELANDVSSMIGGGDTDKEWKHNVEMIDNMLAKNGLKQRDFK